MSDILAPDRPRLADAWACVSGTDADGRSWWNEDGASVWEALIARGVIPEAWADDPARRFAGWCSMCGGTCRGELPVLLEPASRNYGVKAPPCDTCDGRGWHPLAHPTSVADAVALASNPDGIVRAEQLAREVVARLRPWCSLRPDRVAWRVVAADVAMGEAQQRAGEWLNVEPSSIPLAEEIVGMAAAMLFSPSRPGEGPDPGWWRDPGTADLMTPAACTVVEPLLALALAGYAIDAITDDAIVLVCPARGGGP